MNLAIFTLYEGDYHLGVAALINSAVKCGFKGRIFVYYKDRLPPWADSEQKQSLLRQHGVDICFEHCLPPRHFGYHKPFVALKILEAHPELDGVVYADPDVVFLAPWSFFEKWVDCGVALCLDGNFPWLHKKHPWRQDWRALVMRAGLSIQHDPTEYANSGFFALTKNNVQFLRNWMTITLQFEKERGNTSKFSSDRFNSVAGDQDILAASLYASLAEPSYLGLEGMGFNGFYFVMSHALDNPKPWRNGFVKLALQGQCPSTSAKLWLEHMRFPIKALSRLKYLKTQLDIAIALILSRLWKR
jgi:hypothetical protein